MGSFFGFHWDPSGRPVGISGLPVGSLWDFRVFMDPSDPNDTITDSKDDLGCWNVDHLLFYFTTKIHVLEALSVELT